jgi:type II secretory pathway component PulM
MAANKGLDTREKIALISGGAILVISVIYWIDQVLGVMEMLKLAYG